MNDLLNYFYVKVIFIYCALNYVHGTFKLF